MSTVWRQCCHSSSTMSSPASRARRKSSKCYSSCYHGSAVEDAIMEVNWADLNLWSMLGRTILPRVPEQEYSRLAYALKSIGATLLGWNALILLEKGLCSYCRSSLHAFTCIVEFHHKNCWNLRTLFGTRLGCFVIFQASHSVATCSSKR